MVKSTSRTLATSMSMTLSLLALKSCSIWVISAAVSFSRLISNYLSYFLINPQLLFLLMRGTQPTSAVYICSLPARQLISLPSVSSAYVAQLLPFLLGVADDFVRCLFGLK